MVHCPPPSWPLLCITVMSEYSLDEPGFKPPGAPVPAPPSSSDSSVEASSDGRRKCIACPRRMSKKTVDRHTLCVNCRGFDCDINTRCEEYLEWPEEEVRLYAKYHKSLKSKDLSSKSKTLVPTPPPADSRHSQQPAPCADLQAQVDSLSATVHSLSDTLSSRLDTFMSQLLSHTNQLSSQTRLEPDAGEPQPGETAGESRMFQSLGAPSRTPLVPPLISINLLQDVRAPASEQLGSAASLGSGCRSAFLSPSGSSAATSAFWGASSSTLHLWLGPAWPSAYSCESWLRFILGVGGQWGWEWFHRPWLRSARTPVR